MLGLIVLAGVLADVVAPYSPTAVGAAQMFAPPSAGHPLGTDRFGRDVLSRIVHGVRVSLGIAGASILVALVAGGALGLLAGVGRGVDQLLGRVMDVFFAFPPILLAIAVVSALGPGVLNTTIAVGIWGAPTVVRLVRGSVLSLRESEYVGAARALGATGSGLVVRHVLPNLLPTVIVYATLFMANAILVEAALSFLGLGVQPPTASWGLMVSTGRDLLLVAPHVATIPGVAIMVAVLGFNLLGDGLRDALDPRLRGDGR